MGEMILWDTYRFSICPISLSLILSTVSEFLLSNSVS